MKITFLIGFLAINVQKKIGEAIGGVAVGISASRRKDMVGGVPTTIREAPYFVSIRYQGRHLCGGSLITTHHVLTAGSCIFYSMDQLKKLNAIVVVGSDKRNAGGTGHTIWNVIRPAFYCTDSLRNDVAVIKLLERVKLTATTNIIALPSGKLEYYKHGTVVGFPSKKNRFEVIELRQMNVSLRPAENCWLREPDPRYRNEGQICGIVLRQGEQPMNDYGGPLVCNDEVVGISSWRSEESHHDTYYTDVRFHLDFILKAIET